MAEILLPLFEVLGNQSSKTEDVQRVTEALKEHYSNPDMILAYFEIIQTNQSPTIRGASCTALHDSIKMHWPNIVENPQFKEEIKNLFLQALTKETNMRNRNLLLDSMNPIFMTELDDWSPFLQFIESIYNDPQYYFMTLASCFDSLPFQAVGAFFIPICQLIENVFEGSDEGAIKFGAELLTVMFTFLSAEPESMLPLFQALNHCINNALNSNASYINNLINSLSSIIESAPEFCSPEDLITPLFADAQNEEIPASTRVLLIDPIVACVKRYQEQLESIFPDCIALSLHLAKLCFEENECFEDQRNCFFSTVLLETLVEYMDPNDFFEEFWANFEEDSPEFSIAFACGLISFIEYIPTVVALHFKDIAEFSVNLLENEHHCFQDAGISVLMELIGRVSEPISDFSNQIIQDVINSIDSNADKDPSLITTAFSFLVEFLYIVPLAIENLEPLFEKTISYAKEFNSSYTHLIISCLAALISAARSEAYHFAPAVLPIIMEAAEMQSEEHQLIQSAGIEALSTLIKFAPQSATEIYDHSLNIFVEACTQTQDIQLYCSSILAFRNISLHQTPELLNALPTVIDRAISLLNVDTDDRTPGDETSAMVDARQASCQFLAELVKRHKDVVMPSMSQLAKIAARLVDFDNDDVSNIALKLAVRCSVALNEVPQKLIGHLVKGLQSQKQNLVCTCFKGFEKLLKNGVPTVIKENEDTLQDAIRNGFAFFEGGLLCQHSTTMQGEDEAETEEDQGEENLIENNDVDLKDSVFSFFATLAQYRPADFPLEEFWKYTESTEENPDLRIECIGVLTELFAVYQSELPPVYKTAIKSAFFQSLTIIEFTRPPHPIAAIRCAIEVQGHASPDELKYALQVASNVLETENEGQLYYWPTVAATISLLFTLIKVCGSQIDLSEFIEKMLALAPRCLVEAESENIVSSVINLPDEIKQMHAEYIVEILRSALDRGVKKGISEGTAQAAQNLLESLLK
ncbi:hypothetical protein TVAG_027750 [Trichomonas vaginalis G3]|uniref:Importin N-terminal domain-containing protein n=1 Tax=Trichomonas vaginalis (strain ATCC PRA-98 / G3) TaxID=412133 RepID=A2E514_TRIV3|nr:importin beta family [Trichomonas vaginalis G3]EAY12222.1 hypothetical protein TVAG_027750 [Trichomonas vaginalis G3]KAI5536008.1 importin beta family [Trichomonas vaginalis G3]|eukprot:XP_001324445.1 hypothetical protein [Trichomonas vaginalis G3]